MRDHFPIPINPPGDDGQEETEQIFSVLKKEFFPGTLGKNLMDVTFTTQQVVDSEEHRLLMAPEKFCFE